MGISIMVLPRRKGRWWDWGAGTVHSVSLKHQLGFPFSHMGRLQNPGGLGGHQEEGIPGSGGLDACSSKPLCSVHRAAWSGGFSHTGAVVLCRRCLAATQLNVRKCPSSQGLWVSWSPGHLLRKWASTEEWVLAFPFTAQSWAFCFCLDLYFGN